MAVMCHDRSRSLVRAVRPLFEARDPEGTLPLGAGLFRVLLPPSRVPRYVPSRGVMPMY